METRYLKYVYIAVACAMAASIAIADTTLFIISSAALLAILLAMPSSKTLVVKKIRFNKDSNKFEIFVENTGVKPMWMNYSLRSIQKAPEKPDTKFENSMELMKASTWNPQESYSLLSEDSFGKIVKEGEMIMLESKNISQEMWNPKLNNIIQFNALYGDPESKKPGKIETRLILDVCETHPYLRTVGSERAFILTKGDGAEVAKASSLKELASQMAENPDAFYHHWGKGDIQKWVENVLGDSELAKRLSEINTPREKLPKKFEDIIGKRILELNYNNYSGKHPLLMDVESEHAFIVKMDEKRIVGSALSLKALMELLKASPIESISFHLQRGNDIANWVEKVIGDFELAENLNQIESSNPEYAKLNAIEMISHRIRELGG